MFKSLGLVPTIPIEYQELLPSVQVASRAADLDILREAGAPPEDIKKAEEALAKARSTETLRVVAPEPIPITSKMGKSYHEAPVCVRMSSGALMELEVEGPPTIMSGGFIMGKFDKYQVTLNVSPGDRVYSDDQPLPEDPQSQEHALFYGIPPPEEVNLSKFPENASVIDLITWKQYESMLAFTSKSRGLKFDDIKALRKKMTEGSESKNHHTAISWKQSKMYVNVKHRIGAPDANKVVKSYKCKVMEGERELPFESLVGHSDTDFVVLPTFSFRVHKSMFMTIAPTLMKVVILARRPRKSIKITSRSQRLIAAYRKIDAAAAGPAATDASVGPAVASPAVASPAATDAPVVAGPAVADASVGPAATDCVAESTTGASAEDDEMPEL